MITEIYFEMKKEINNLHPGIILKEEFLNELGLSMTRLAQAISVPTNRISTIIRGRRRITADTDLRLSKYFRLSEGYWLRLQNQYDLMEAKRSNRQLVKNIKPHKAQHQEA